jgi:hypothetical protein
VYGGFLILERFLGFRDAELQKLGIEVSQTTVATVPRASPWSPLLVPQVEQAMRDVLDIHE